MDSLVCFVHQWSSHGIVCLAYFVLWKIFKDDLWLTLILVLIYNLQSNHFTIWDLGSMLPNTRMYSLLDCWEFLLSKIQTSSSIRLVLLSLSFWHARQLHKYICRQIHSVSICPIAHESSDGICISILGEVSTFCYVRMWVLLVVSASCAQRISLPCPMYFPPIYTMCSGNSLNLAKQRIGFDKVCLSAIWYPTFLSLSIVLIIKSCTQCERSAICSYKLTEAYNLRPWVGWKYSHLPIRLE